MPITRLIRPLTSAVLAVAAVLLISPGASAQSNGRGDKLDKFLRYRSKHLSGRSRVIVEFNGDTDVRVFGKRGAAGRKLGRNSQVAEVDNAELANLASNPRVKRVMHDRPTFATLERTGLSTGAALVRLERARRLVSHLGLELLDHERTRGTLQGLHGRQPKRVVT
jgi:hypothetical protein